MSFQGIRKKKYEIQQGLVADLAKEPQSPTQFLQLYRPLYVFWLSILILRHVYLAISLGPIIRIYAIKKIFIALKCKGEAGMLRAACSLTILLQLANVIQSVW
ncbi:hypothetical protein DB41_FN00020 [Neochlamydia sp. TUME1]|nr:hypothetical protein DB41_FN00020 [Neochlamydia sp. TUME1]